MNRLPNSRVTVGMEAINLMNCPLFKQEWRELYESCPWATAAQDPEVTSLRCNTYQSRAMPILVETRYQSELVGLLALAKVDGENGVLGAICEDGEYHVWLAKPEYAELVMPSALLALDRKLFPIRLHYIPAGTPLDWVSNARWGNRCKLTEIQTPILRLNQPNEIRKFLHSKSTLRRHKNQLERLGQLTFRKIDGIHDFERVLERFVEMYNLRKQSKIGHSIFDQDALKRNYIYSRQEMPRMQHTTVLELDGKIIAAHIGLEGRPQGGVSLSGIAHDPSYDRYSPGSILLMELINLLCEEGYATFDLTPGGDLYKARWTDNYETVYELEIFASRMQLMADSALDLTKRCVSKLGRSLSEFCV